MEKRKEEMVKIAITIPKNRGCEKCPFHKEANPWSSDGWDKMLDWICSATEDNRKVAGSVEWHDKIPVPDWCPILVED